MVGRKKTTAKKSKTKVSKQPQVQEGNRVHGLRFKNPAAAMKLSKRQLNALKNRPIAHPCVGGSEKIASDSDTEGEERRDNNDSDSNNGDYDNEEAEEEEELPTTTARTTTTTAARTATTTTTTTNLVQPPTATRTSSSTTTTTTTKKRVQQTRAGRWMDTERTGDRMSGVHYPGRLSTEKGYRRRMNCRVCQVKTSYACLTCKAPLCTTTDGLCWYRFHYEDNFQLSNFPPNFDMTFRFGPPLDHNSNDNDDDNSE